MARKPIILAQNGVAKPAAQKAPEIRFIDSDKTPFMEPPSQLLADASKTSAGKPVGQLVLDRDKTPFRAPPDSLLAGAVNSRGPNQSEEADIDFDKTTPRPVRAAQVALKVPSEANDGPTDMVPSGKLGAPISEPPRGVPEARQSSQSVSFPIKQEAAQKSAVSGASVAQEKSFATEPSVVVKQEAVAQAPKAEKTQKKMDWTSFVTFFGGAGLAPAAALYLSGFGNKYAIAGYVVFEAICTAFFSYVPDKAKSGGDSQGGPAKTGPDGTMISGGSS